MVLSLPGDQDSHKPYSYQSEEFGMISKTRVTNICEDKFGSQRNHDGEKRSLVFDIKVIQRLQNNYSPIKKIEILYKSDTNTSNTFNTFWNMVERNRSYDNVLVNIEKMSMN